MNITPIGCVRRGLLIAVSVLLLIADAAAQSRLVFVNGQRLADAQVAALAGGNCSDIPDGAYWLNTKTGAWGYAGNPQVQGVVGDGCRQQTSGSGGAFRKGPFATMNRATQEANAYRAQGYRAAPFHNGDGYYVDVRR